MPPGFRLRDSGRSRLQRTAAPAAARERGLRRHSGLRQGVLRRRQDRRRQRDLHRRRLHLQQTVESGGGGFKQFVLGV